MQRHELSRKCQGRTGTNRAPLMVRCTATVEPEAASMMPRPNPVARAGGPSAAAYTGRPPLRSGSPRRLDGGRAPGGQQADVLSNRPDVERRDVERRENERRGPGFAPGRGDGSLPAASQPPRSRGRLPEVAFLDDDDERLRRIVVAAFTKHVSNGRTVIVRSLGRSGTTAAIKFVLALRAAGAASAEQVDVRFRLNPRDPIPGFGAPLMMFVETIPGRIALPEDGSPLVSPFTVSKNTDPSRLNTGVVTALQNLKDGSFLRMEMVGADNIYRGLSALSVAREQLGRPGGMLFGVPEMTTAPARSSPVTARPDNAGAAPAAGPAAAVAAPSTASTSLQASVEFTSEAGPVMVEVLRLYVGRVPRAEPLPGGAVGAAAAAGQPVVTVAAAAAGDAGAARVAGEGQIVVSVAEWESLRGALGSMMEQQKLLAQLLEQQQRAAAAAAAATGPAAGGAQADAAAAAPPASTAA